jgi:hypothetical protein
VTELAHLIDRLALDDEAIDILLRVARRLAGQRREARPVPCTYPSQRIGSERGAQRDG